MPSFVYALNHSNVDVWNVKTDENSNNIRTHKLEIVNFPNIIILISCFFFSWRAIHFSVNREKVVFIYRLVAFSLSHRFRLTQPTQKPWCDVICTWKHQQKYQFEIFDNVNAGKRSSTTITTWEQRFTSIRDHHLKQQQVQYEPWKNDKHHTCCCRTCF